MTDYREGGEGFLIPSPEATPQELKSMKGIIYQSIDKTSHGDPERRMELLENAKDFYEDKFPGESFQWLIDEAPVYSDVEQPA
jgi:hypothetical protein